MLKLKRFDLRHWLISQKANYYTAMADKAIIRYKKRKGIK